MLKILQARLLLFNSTWTTDFEMFKLDLEKARNKRSNCQDPLDHQKSKRVPEKHNFCFIDSTKAFDCVDHNKLWKILQEMGIPDHLTCSWVICRQVKKQQLEVDMEQQTGSIWGKEYIKAVYCHPAYLTSLQSTLCEMPGWMKHTPESRFLGEISITSDMQMTPPLWPKVKRNWRASWWKWKRRLESWLKIQHSKNKDHGIRSHQFMTNSWGNSGNSDRLYFLGLQNHCRWLLEKWN